VPVTRLRDDQVMNLRQSYVVCGVGVGRVLNDEVGRAIEKKNTAAILQEVAIGAVL
jgi:hypothetical protein